jgi:8-oxo-dGTP pyrophosphatase MutT (NUDIX family)
MKVVGSVGLVIFDPKGKVLLLKELESKIHYGKLAGMLSFPIETIEEGETSDQTIIRLVDEEIGVPLNGLTVFNKEFMIQLNGSFTESISVYVCKCAQRFVAHPKDSDVEYFGWRWPRQIMKFTPGLVRLEVKPVLGSILGR